MGTIAQLAKQKRRLLTSSELNSLIGKPLSPCPDCGNPTLAVFQDGAMVCEDCNPDHRRTVALRLYCWTDNNGEMVARRWDDILAERDFAVAVEAASFIVHRPGGDVHVIVDPRYRMTKAERRMTSEEWFESLPVPGQGMSYGERNR